MKKFILFGNWNDEGASKKFVIDTTDYYSTSFGPTYKVVWLSFVRPHSTHAQIMKYNTKIGEADTLQELSEKYFLELL